MSDTYQLPPALLTAEDSKRVADAIIYEAERLSREIQLRHDAMCAQLEQTAYIKANPTRY